MKRRLTYALAAATVALGIAAGVGGSQALAGQLTTPPDSIPPGSVAPAPAFAGQVPIPPDTEPPGISGDAPTTASIDIFLPIGDEGPTEEVTPADDLARSPGNCDPGDTCWPT